MFFNRFLNSVLTLRELIDQFSGWRHMLRLIYCINIPNGEDDTITIWSMCHRYSYMHLCLDPCSGLQLLLYLHFPVHDVSQPQWKRMKHALLASLSVVTRYHWLPLVCLTNWGHLIPLKVCMYSELFVRWYMAAWVSDLFFRVFYQCKKTMSDFDLILAKSHPVAYHT